MLKFQELSDLHVDTWKYTHEVAADVLVVAGDWRTSQDKGHQMGLIKGFGEKHKAVLCVLGNHEYYDTEMDACVTMMREQLAGSPNIKVLNRDVEIIGDVRFLGATMWTPLDTLNNVEGIDIQRYMPDFRYIRMFGMVVNFDTITYEYNKTIRWLDERLAEPWAGKTVVITHHAPLRQCHDAEYLQDSMYKAFSTDLTEKFEGDWKGKIDVWCYGHIHSPKQFEAHGIRFYCNPRGYPHEIEEDDFNPKLVIEV